MVFAFVPNDSDSDERKKRIKILNDYRLLPVTSERHKSGHLRITRAHHEISATLAAIDYQYSVIRN